MKSMIGRPCGGIALAILLTACKPDAVAPPAAAALPPEEWEAVVLELEEQLAADVLLGSSSHEVLTRALAARGLSLESFRAAAKEAQSAVIQRASFEEPAQELADAISELDVPEAAELSTVPVEDSPRILAEPDPWLATASRLVHSLRTPHVGGMP